MQRMIVMAKTIKYCDIYTNKICDDCNECNICDLDPNKLCDSCGKCIGLEGDEETLSADFLEIKIEGILDEETDGEDYVLDEDVLDEEKAIEDESLSSSDMPYDFIEDIPKLKKEYDIKINEILNKKGSND